jgi:hypothetical protein
MRRVLRHRRRGQGLKGFEACAEEPVDGLLEALLFDLQQTPHKRLAVRIAHSMWFSAGRPFFQSFSCSFEFSEILFPYVRHKSDRLTA